MQLSQVESGFRSLKSELGIQPVYRHLEHRADAPVPIAFLAYCLRVTLKNRTVIQAPGLTPTAVLERLATIQMVYRPAPPIPPLTPKENRRRSAAVSRKLRILRAHRLIQKVPKTRRYQSTSQGRLAITAILTTDRISIALLNKAAA